MSLHNFNTLPIPEFLLILQVGVSEYARSSGNFNAEWAVRPPSSNVAAMPDDASASAISFLFRTEANIKLMRKNIHTRNILHLYAPTLYFQFIFNLFSIIQTYTAQ